MKIGFKFKKINGFGQWYNYCYKQNNNMITKEAKQRLKILNFWQKYGLEAAKEAFNGVSQSTLYEWRKTYRSSGFDLKILNPGSQAPHNTRKREVNPDIISEIRRLRLKVCPNMGKDKVKIFLDKFCAERRIDTISGSTIGRIINDKKIYHHRQKVSHFGVIKTIRKKGKQRKPKDFIVEDRGDLVEIDTIVKFVGSLKRYVVTAVDVHSRYAFAWGYERANSSNTRDFLYKLKAAVPFRIRGVQTDNGSEFHKYFAQYLEQTKTIHYWNYPGKPYRNGHVEKYNRTIQEEFMDQNEMHMENISGFNARLVDWLLWYNIERPHWSLRLQSPVDFLIKNHLVSEMCWTNTNI
jgi:IS30 family transposase